ncbi:MAG: hypothetical protein RLZ65_992 [Actinomycetota bacterium]|jgi:hypothetical protein
MSKLGWFVAGISLGAITVIQLRDNPKAQVALDEAIEAAKEFATAVKEGYLEREAELEAPAPKPVRTAAAKPAAKKPAAKKPAAKRTTTTAK